MFILIIIWKAGSERENMEDFIWCALSCSKMPHHNHHYYYLLYCYSVHAQLLNTQMASFVHYINTRSCFCNSIWTHSCPPHEHKYLGDLIFKKFSESICLISWTSLFLSFFMFAYLFVVFICILFVRFLFFCQLDI